ncbi:MAG: type I pullulanase [Blastocatellia bacterium]|nr:type I pullulanase [Blastocatellia bacterium]
MLKYSLLLLLIVMLITEKTDHLLTKASPRQLSHPADSFVSTQPLGAIYSPTATTFRVFAPTASRVETRIYSSPFDNQARKLEMTRNSDGTWQATLEGDCRGLYYTYTAAGEDPGFNPERELVDPYAQAVTAYNGRAIVVADQTPIAPRPDFPQQDAIIYELHIRDFTIDPDCGIQRRGKYLAFTEQGTHLYGRPDIHTGLDHLTELGINTVQIMPIGEFQSDEASDQYGWGYDSVHFNSPDGWYATERANASRVTETKKMIDALHKRGIKVVLDVVYNHTLEDIKSRIYSFEGLVPGYYYRRKNDGSYWNGSGVGNEFRSEAPMARRFIIDSVKYWVNEYKVDGFRFDLMGLIDLETMKLLVKELRSIDPNLLIYGEPWSAGETPIEITNKGKQKGLNFSVFNDNFRDALKGSVFKPREQGYVQAGINIDVVKRGIKGSIDDFTNEPIESINYVECHDNHTFWDRLITSTFDDSNITDADRRAMDKLGAAIILTSQGIPFFQSGQELLRSKGGDENSYNKPDSVNMLRWSQKVSNYDIFLYYRGLVALRKAHPIFTLGKAELVRDGLKFLDTDLFTELPKNGIGYVLTDVTGKDSWQRALVLFNPDKEGQAFQIPTGNWQVYVDAIQVSTNPLKNSRAKIKDRTVIVPARSALVLGEEKNDKR